MKPPTSRYAQRRAAEAKKKNAIRRTATQAATGVAGAAGGAALGQSANVKELLGQVIVPATYEKVGEHKLPPGSVNAGTWVDTIAQTNEAAQKLAGEQAALPASVALGIAGLGLGIYAGTKIHRALNQKQFKNKGR